MSFAKNITTPIDIPSAGPAPEFSGSTVSDVTKLASFGLGIFKRQEAKDAEAARQKRLGELTGKGQSIASSLLQRMDQEDVSSIAQALFVDKAVTASTLSPVERGFITEQVNNALSTKLFSAAVDEEKSADQLKTDEILTFDKHIQSLILGGKNLDQMSGDEKRDALDAGREIALRAERAKRSSEKLATTPSVTAFAEAMDSVFALEYAANEQLLGSLVQQVTKAGGDPDSVQLLSDARFGLVRQLGQQETIVRDMFVQVSKDPAVTGGDLTKAKAIQDNALKQIAEQKTRLESMDDEQFQNAAKMANLFKSQMEVELRESAPEIYRLKEIAGSGYNALMGILMNRLPNFKNAAVGALEKGAVAGFLQSPEGQATLAGTFDLMEFNHMLEGKSLTDYDQEKVDSAAAMRWGMISPVIESPEALSGLPQKQIDNIITATIQVLDRADETGDRESLVNANTLLSSNAVKALIEKSSNDETKKVLANYVASSTLALFEDKLKDAMHGFIKYDAASNKFISRETGPQPKSTSHSQFGGISGVTRKTSSARQIKDMNKKLDNAAELLIKYNPAIDNLKQAKDYLLIGAPSDSIQGTLSPFTGVKRQAVEQGVDIKELEKELALKKRVQEFSDSITGSDEAITAVLQGKTSSKVEEKPVPSDDLSDLSDEEFAEFQKQQLLQRKKRGQTPQ